MKLKNTLILVSAILFSWLNILLVAGTLTHFLQRTSILSFLALALSLGMAMPTRRIYHNAGRLEEDFKEFLYQKKLQLAISIPIFGLTTTLFHIGVAFPISNILNLSFATSSLLFQPIKLSYVEILPEVGRLTYSYAQLYLHFLWIYLPTGLILRARSKILERTKGSGERDSEETLKASIVPFKHGGNGEVNIEIYVVTGKHSFFRIPESFCKECNMFYQAAKQASEEIEKEVNIEIKSYWTRFLRPLRKGGYHAPVMLVNGKLVAQGYDIPDTNKIAQKL